MIARTSSFAYKGKSADIRQVGQELGARYIVEGSVRKSSEKIRIVAQLIDASSGHHVWAERYDEESGDISALQDGVIQRIAVSVGGIYGQIRVATSGEAWRKASLQEYDYFLRIHGLILRGPKADLAEARQVALDGLKHFPDSALLRIKLGWTYMQDVDRGYSDNPQGDLKRAFELANEGMATRDLPTLAQMHGHWLMSLASLYQRDFERALSERQAALAIAPSVPVVLIDLSRVLAFAGDPSEAIVELEQAFKQAPRVAPLLRNHLGLAYYTAGQYRKAIEQISGLSVQPFKALLFRAASFAALDEWDQARAAAAELMKKSHGTTLVTLREMLPFRDVADQERILVNLRKAGIPEG